MILYRDATGIVVGTQVEAKRMGKGWSQLIVPTDKQGLIDYLNAQPAIDDSYGPGADGALVGPPFQEIEDMDDGGQPVAPKVTAVPHANDFARRVLQEGRELDQIGDWIATTEGWQLGKLVDACLARMKQLKEGMKA